MSAFDEMFADLDKWNAGYAIARIGMDEGEPVSGQKIVLVAVEVDAAELSQLLAEWEERRDREMS